MQIHMVDEEMKLRPKKEEERKKKFINIYNRGDLAGVYDRSLT